MENIRLATAVVFYLDQLYSAVHAFVTLRSLVDKRFTDRWIFTFVCAFVYPWLQYGRSLAGLRLARKFSELRCSCVAVLGVPIFLIHMLLFAHQETISTIDYVAGVIAFILTFSECFCMTFLLFGTRNWSACTPISLLHLLIFCGSVSVRILTVII